MTPWSRIVTYYRQESDSYLSVSREVSTLFLRQNKTMKGYRQYNPNPLGYNVGDCAIRALSKALNQTWEQTYCALSAYGFRYCNMPSANFVWGMYLKDRGFERIHIDKEDYTVEQFVTDHSKGVYVLALQGHVVTVVDGYYYDSWDSGKEIVYYYWRLKNVRE